jgi:hypothetical protein
MESLLTTKGSEVAGVDVWRWTEKERENGGLVLERGKQRKTGKIMQGKAGR